VYTAVERGFEDPVHEPSQGPSGPSLPAGQAPAAHRVQPGANQDDASLMIGLDLEHRHAAICEVRRAEVGAIEQPGSVRRLHRVPHTSSPARRTSGSGDAWPRVGPGWMTTSPSPRTVTLPGEGSTPPTVVTCSTTSDAPEGCGIGATGWPAVEAIAKTSAAETRQPGVVRTS
jgi:hypothetical protein